MVQLQEVTFKDLRQFEVLNLQGTHRVLYVDGAQVDPIIRFTQKGGDLITLLDGSVWLTTAVLEQWDAGWMKVSITLQDGK